MIAQLVVVLIFLASAYITWTRGVAFTCMLVYLPVQFFLASTEAIRLPLLPDMTSQFAVGYGLLAGLLFRGGEHIPFRWNILDTIVTSLWMLAVVSEFSSEGLSMARNALGDGFLGMITPYFMARWAFFSAPARRVGFWSVALCAVILCLLCPIEMRLRPQIWSRILEQFGLYEAANSMPLYRFGLARAQTTFWQPMDQGLAGAIMA
ncbi:MAG: hypothetical protein NZ561_04365, partial [Phycisphaerae bacterium]|nr:hypothetical protein [Phycisphaerae bacterium]